VLFLRVVVFASNKGGVGKTTLATIYAEGALLAGLKVCCVDLDVFQHNFQGNLHYFSEAGGAAPEWKDEIPDSGFELCVVDTPPSLGAVTLAAVNAASFVVAPLAPSRDALKGLQPILQERRRRFASVGVVLNMFDDKRVTDLWVHYTAWKEFKDIGITIIAMLKESASIRRNLLFGEPWNKGLHPTAVKGYLDFAKWATKGESMNEKERQECVRRFRPNLQRVEKLFGITK
jgi:cellulose biosynthesis protein BcsQ